MNIFTALRLPKHAYASVRMPMTYAQYLCSVINFTSRPSADLKYRRNDSGTYSKYTSDHTEPDDFGTLKDPLEKSAKSQRSLFTKSSQFKNKTRVTIKTPQTDESDVFGNLSENSPMWYPDMYDPPKEDNDLSDDSVIVKNISKRFRRPEEYLKEMKRLVEEKKIKEALDLFVEMKKNFVTPTLVHYVYMIGVCGRVGYTEMAFKLLRQMTDRSYKVTSATLTGLFNACAESPFPEYGLKKAALLKEKIETKNWPLNKITYQAMIKAFGKCGDLNTAFEIADDMAKADIKIDVSTYNFLLTSCVSNKESGFTYAVEVWRKMTARKCLPNIFTYNLLLRATRDCDVGPQEISSLLLQHWSSYSKRPYGFLTKESISKETILQLKSGQDNSVTKCSKNASNNEYSAESSQGTKINEPLFQDEPKYELQTVFKTSITTRNPETGATSLLSARPVNGPEILELVNLKTASDRLNLIGGMEGFLELMSAKRVKPDIKTFTLLLECLPPDIKDEEKLLFYIDSYQVKPDIDFFNALIRRRNFRKETEAAKNVLVLINKYELSPNIMTFGVLALGCRSLQQATIFISEMEKLGSTPNIETVGCMLRNACVSLDFSYMKYVMKLMEKLQIKTNEKVLLSLEKTLSDVRKNIILMEQGKEVDKFYQRNNLQADFKEFSKYYNEWLKRIKFESEQHPWLQYRTEIIDRTKKEETPLWEIERQTFTSK